jgi:hypothetical protein
MLSVRKRTRILDYFKIDLTVSHRNAELRQRDSKFIKIEPVDKEVMLKTGYLLCIHVVFWYSLILRPKTCPLTTSSSFV